MSLRGRNPDPLITNPSRNPPTRMSANKPIDLVLYIINFH